MNDTETPEQAATAKAPGLSWKPFLTIIILSALAHLWCVKSQFYMDDFAEIRDNEVVMSGAFPRTSPMAWTYFCYLLQTGISGFSAPVFHAVNWVLHTLVACSLFLLGRRLLEPRHPPGLALFAALLFAVHPLGSEIPNYARSQDLAWVTLFSLLACWLLLRFLHDGSRLSAVGCIVALLGAAFSKGPGLFHVLPMVGIVGLASLTKTQWKQAGRRIWWLVGGLALVFVALSFTNIFGRLAEATKLWSEPRFVGHAYTLARVFWEFSWLGVVPTNLSADHHIAETLVKPGGLIGITTDVSAKLAAVGLIFFTFASLVMVFRAKTRLLGVCLLLFASAILFRMFYLMPEYMPEYRIYPGLPWFCLAASLVLYGLWQRWLGKVSPLFPVALLLGGFALLSAKRSFQWHDLDLLMGDVLRQYTTQVRAVWELQEKDAAAGNWRTVVARQREDWPQVARRFHEENRRLAPARELPTGHFVLAEVASVGLYAQALAHLETPAAGLAELDRLESYMRRLGLNSKGHRIHWEYLSHARGLVYETAGDFSTALACLNDAETVRTTRQRDRDRVAAKLAAARK